MKKSIILLALLTAACGMFASNPKKTVSRYLEALSKEKYAAAYDRVSSRDQAAKTVEAFSSENAAGANPVMSNPAGKPRIEILDVEVDGEKAKVRVAVSPAGMAEGTPPVTQVYRLVKEGEDWRMFLGWAAQALLAEARRLREDGKLQEASEKYAKALEADPDNAEAYGEKLDAERLALVQEQKQSYLLNNVEVLNLKVTRGSGRGGPSASVSGKILNNGHRTLTQVEIGVYFLSADGKVIAERTYRPIPSSDVTYYGEDRTLRRGYVKDFGYIVEGPIPKEWAGKARAVVTRIEFEEERG